MLRRLLLVLALGVLLVPIAGAAPESLAADGRVAVVADRQGLAFVRPAGRSRWTPLTSRALLFPGDRVRTETRGANALDLRLPGGARLTVGPGALAEARKDGSFDLFAGEVEALGTASAPLVVRGGAAGSEVRAEAATWLRAADGRLERLPAAPRWLTGYRANTSDEWMGALITTIDGREVPLSVGYHKVDVEVRDQVARTTIEESFVNATDARLEGVFRFPLPAEASISGFGMWIGNELVEADVVERERARQIYEDILRRKKDPGLLEWAGGNVFQARVFPIEPRSEKRIRLVYTEVLPLEGTTWRYRYALRSELLRQRPLRELQITVRAASTARLAEVTCPTHADAKVTADAHTAQVELSQRDVSPDRDFEVAARLGATDGLTVVTHRRGEDGWFLLLVQPPDTGSAAWQRDLVPEGRPLDLVLAVDTSGSVDEAARKAQTSFVTSLLGLLGPEDRVRVATIDVETRWMDEAAKPADPDTTDRVLRFLDARPSRGWTDLDRGFDALLKAAGDGTHVVYLGDGIGTSGDGDPVALAQRIRRKGAGTRATFHAVAPASTYEKGVLDAVASLGGGSVRSLREDPAGAAQRLVTEAALPLVRDLKVEVQGLPTARVYPATLPNLPLGAQQTVLGRFLPSQAGTKATVVVTGTLDGKPVRFTSPLVVAGDEEGNSFLPRLWARRHLDALLAQGDAAAVKDEIVRFSTEYGILTPHTSLLVLETDEDREQYGVERRVRARDGEAEFAAARDRVALEVARKAAQEARTWRVNLRRAMLRQIAGLGRDLPIPVPEVGLGDVFGTFAGREYAEEGLTSWSAGGDLRRLTYGLAARDESFLGESAGFDGGDTSFAPASPAPVAAAAPAGEPALGGEEAEEEERDAEKSEAKSQEQADDDLPSEESLGDSDEPAREADAPMAQAKDARFAERRRAAARGFTSPEWQGHADGDGYLSGRVAPFGPRTPDLTSFGFPAAGRAEYDPPLPAEPPAVDTLTGGLLRKTLGSDADEALRVRITLRGESLDPLRERTRSTWSQVLLRSPERWFHRRASQGQEPTETSLDGEVVTSLSGGVRLARAWKGGPQARWAVAELRRMLGYPDAYAVAGAVLMAGGDTHVVRVTIGRPPSPGTEIWTLDPRTGALLVREHYHFDDLLSRTQYFDHVDVGGTWWPQRVEQQDERGRVVGRTHVAVEALAGDAFDRAFGQAVAGREDVLTAGPDLPKVRAARRALAQGKAGFAERLVLALERVRAGRHDEAWAHLDAALAPFAGKPGVSWVRAAALAQTRRGEDLRRLLSGDLARLAAANPALGWPLAQRVLSHAQALGTAERLALVDALEAAWTAGSGPDARWAWSGARASALEQAGRHVEARALLAARAAERPWDLHAVLAQSQALDAVDPDAGWTYLSAAIEKQGPWYESERDVLESRRSDEMVSRRLPSAVTPHLEAWTKARPDAYEAWHRWVSARYLEGRDAEADGWVEQALGTLGRTDAFSREERARLDAAVDLALGQGWSWWAYRLPARFREPLAGLARALLAGRDDARLDLARELLQEGRLTSTDAGAALLADAKAMLLAPDAIGTLPLRRLGLLVEVVDWTAGAMDAPAFERSVAALLARLKVEATAGERAVVAEAAQHALSERGERERTPEVLRAWRDAESGYARLAVEQRLFRALTSLKHDAAREDEASALLPALIPESHPDAWRLAQAGALLRALVPWAVEGRTRALLGTPEQQSARTRAEAREAERKARHDARAALAERLQGPAARTPNPPGGRTPNPPGGTLGTWTTLERLALLSENRTSLDEVADTALALLAVANGGSRDPEDHPLQPVLAVLRSRAALLLAHAATRRGAPEALATQALAEFQKRWADDTHDWRYETFRLLVALDRVEALRTTLAGWLAEPDAEPRWRKALAYLEAELGRLAPAIDHLEALKGVEGALAPQDWNALASWLLAEREDARREAAIRASFEAMGEWQISQRLQQELWAVQRRGPGVPNDLDPTVLPAVHVLLAKAQWPQNHAWVVQSLYQATKDHRILAGLVHGVLGHSAQGAYAFLQHLSGVVAGVHEEAALDALRTTLAERRRTATGTDRRPLALLAALVELRASQVLLKDPGPARRAVQLFEEAAGLALEPGELRPLVDLLGSLPFGPDAEIARARVALLERLAQGAEVASGDRLHAVRALAQVLWNAKRHEEALDRLDAARRETAAAADPRTGPALEQVLEVLVEWLATRARFTDAEALLVDVAERGGSPAAREGGLLRLFRLWGRGLKEGGTFRIGRGEALYRAAAERMEREWAAWPHLGPGIHQAHQQLGVAARDGRVLRDPGGERVRFATERLPALLKGMPGHVAQMAAGEANTLAELAGPRAALRFLLDQAAREPAFYGRIGNDVWSQDAWRLAEWRAKGEPLGALDAPLLAFVLRNLKEQVRSDERNAAAFWQSGNSWFWAAKVPDFVAATQGVAEEAPASAARQFMAGWTLHVMGRDREAIDLLLGALARAALHREGRGFLLDLLLGAKRHADALVVVDGLLAETPEDLGLHVKRARALAALGRPDDAVAALRTGLDRLPGAKPPAPQHVGQVAVEASRLDLHAAAVPWFEDALRRATSPRFRGARAQWRGWLAASLAALGRIDEAVDAAAAAVVGTDQQPRLDAVLEDEPPILERTILEAPDFAAFVARYEARVAQSGADAPLVRKALVRVARKRGDLAQALHHLEVLRALAPEDAAVLRLLVALHAEQGDAERSREALEALVRVDPGDPAAWEDLGNRFAKAGRPDEAERAWTSPIEARPLEPDGHRLLARVRTSQGRPADAAERWAQVTRVRPLEPEGRLEEAKAWIAAGEPARARAPLEQVLAGTWEERFGDVKALAARLLATVR